MCYMNIDEQDNELKHCILLLISYYTDGGYATSNRLTSLS